MRIKRFEFGISTICGYPAWKDPEFGITKSNCGCYILEIWFIHFTWLGDECYLPCQDPACECKFVDNSEDL